jgi:hypothetical protein
MVANLYTYKTAFAFLESIFLLRFSCVKCLGNKDRKWISWLQRFHRKAPTISVDSAVLALRA